MDRLAHLQRLRERHGDVFVLRPARGAPSVVVGGPEQIKRVLTAPADILCAGEGNRGLLGWLLGDHSLLLLDGERHLAHRRLMLPSFHNERLREHAATMRELTAAQLAAWPLGEEVRALPRLRELTLAVVLAAVFGEGGDIAGALRELLPAPLLLANTGEGEGERPLAAVEEIRALIGEEVARRRGARAAAGDGFLADLVAARDEDGAPLSEEEVRDEAMTLIVAGTGTTANSLAWALERLARSPEALDRSAVEATAGEPGPYIAAVVQETLRMRPAVPILARLAKRPLRIGDVDVAAGALVAPCPILVHHRADIYPQPEAFRPERFLERPPGTYTWLPFGGGPRRCIGAGFALLEIREVLTGLLARMTPRAGDERPERMLFPGNALVPDGGATLTFDPVDAR